MRRLRGSKRSSKLSLIKQLNVLKRLDGDVSMFSSRKTNTQPYGVSSPFSLPPFDSLPPLPLPDTAPPFCVFPPPPPQPPSTTLPAPIVVSPPLYFPPILPIGGPPPVPVGSVPAPPEYTPTPNPPVTFPGPNPNPPEIVPSPVIINPGPPEFTPRPPNYGPSPGGSGPGGLTPSPPYYIPIPGVPSGPGGSVPRPPVFHPPVVYPPPTVPPPPYKGPNYPLWCVAKPTVPDPIIEEAMNYACGSGADCASIQPAGSCFEPNSLLAHASYAFNSYWQRTKVAGGTCEFGGTAILVTVDPSKFLLEEAALKYKNN